MKRRKPLNRRSEKASAYQVELDEIRPFVEARAGHRCEVCRRGYMLTIHHKLRRSHGGKNELANLLLVCDPCHREIHANPDKSYRNGTLIRRQ